MASDEDFSDLTDLESDDDDVVPVKRGRKLANKSTSSTGGYKIRNALKVPRATTYTAQALYDQIVSCDINLEPEYQRDVVWTEAKQIGIIDSVFRNFYVPPIIFAVNVYEDGSETKTCIDGKQRLTSIHKFMDGLIPHKDPFTGEKVYFKDVGSGKGPRKQILSEKYRRVFANKQVVCVEYQDITDADEREIFQRVQLGMALTPAEKLQVIKTPRADFIRELQNTYMKEDGWLGPAHLAWDVTRGSDYRGIAQAVCCMDAFSNVKAPQISMAQLEKWLAAETSLKADMRANVEQAYELFADIVQDQALNHVFAQPAKISPLEFIAIGLFLYAHKDKATLGQLAAGIAAMRADVRTVHLDIRMNSRVSKTMIDFIRKWKPGKNDGDAGNPAAQRTTAGVKRKLAIKKKGADGDEDDNAMDVDSDGKDDNARGTPKSKKTTALMRAKAAASQPVNRSSPPFQVKAEPVTTPILYPATDRIAALRRAKETLAQNQAARSAQVPSAPRAFGQGSSSNPQMLPSPGQTYTTPLSLASGSGSAAPNDIPASSSSRPVATSSSLDTSLMATMMRTNPPLASSSRSGQGPNDLPPPTTSGGSSIASADGGGYRSYERDRPRVSDRDYGRERDRDRDSRERDRYRERSRERGRYDDRDRRDSGPYSRKDRRYPSNDSRDRHRR